MQYTRVDIDAESLDLAQQFARKKGIPNVVFYQKDAWQMQFHEEFDVILSSGLNVYEPDPDKVLELYGKFFKALKPGGSLIISVLTYPPDESHETDWNLAAIPSEDLLMEKILLKEILHLHWGVLHNTLIKSPNNSLTICRSYFDIA